VAADDYVTGIHTRIAQAGLTDRFAWPGFVADPVEVMSQIDVLVHPADHESFGRAVVEAMAAGLPVVGTRGGGVAEIVQDGVTGLLADTDDADSLASSIEQIVRDPARAREMGAAGRLRAELHYSLAAHGARMLEVYESAMARPMAQGPSFPRATSPATH
jgi:glycosyltransferase involved in cell wall biosynthesis